MGLSQTALPNLPQGHVESFHGAGGKHVSLELQVQSYLCVTNIMLKCYLQFIHSLKVSVSVRQLPMAMGNRQGNGQYANQ